MKIETGRFDSAEKLTKFFRLAIGVGFPQEIHRHPQDCRSGLQYPMKKLIILWFD
jgi:hypothetical protein